MDQFKEGTEKRTGPERAGMHLPVDENRLREFDLLLEKYKAGKRSVEKRVVAAEQWWKLRNEAEARKAGVGWDGGFRAKSGWLHNVIVSKHADAMESFPEPMILPREPGDREQAKTLTEVIPVILTQNRFDKTYSDAMWQKLKTGTGVYKVTWDADKLNGLGDIDITRVDLLSVFWEPGVTDIQKSRYFFHVELQDNDVLEEQYPQLEGKLKGQTHTLTKFIYDDQVPTDGKSLVIDVYYKRNENGKTVLHYCKYVGDQVLYSTENEGEARAAGGGYSEPRLTAAVGTMRGSSEPEAFSGNRKAVQGEARAAGGGYSEWYEGREGAEQGDGTPLRGYTSSVSSADTFPSRGRHDGGEPGERHDSGEPGERHDGGDGGLFGLWESEMIRSPRERPGLYDHGKYPFVFDPLFPVEGSPAGYGYIDLSMNTQMQVDMLDTAFLRNSMVGATPRYFERVDGAINEQEFMDLTKPIVHVNGPLDANGIAVIDYKPLAGGYLNFYQNKISELRETSGNTESANGIYSGGVTAASSIAALQEAAGKTSRDSSRASYWAFSEIVDMIIELVRQFYDLPRTFRIKGEDGQESFTMLDNEMLQPQAQGIGTVDMGYRLPVFDIKVEVQKRNAYTRTSQNELALQLYQLGFFNPQMAQQALACLDMMDFEGKEDVLQKVQRGDLMMQQMQAMQQLAAAAWESPPGMPGSGKPGKTVFTEKGEPALVRKARERAGNAAVAMP